MKLWKVDQKIDKHDILAIKQVAYVKKIKEFFIIYLKLFTITKL